MGLETRKGNRFISFGIECIKKNTCLLKRTFKNNCVLSVRTHGSFIKYDLKTNRFMQNSAELHEHNPKPNNPTKKATSEKT